MTEVKLGFIKEKTNPRKLRRKFFPDKVGGKPAWLSLSNLPEISDLSCKECRNPLVFLLQVNAKIDENEDTFHRSIYIFICVNGKCYARFSNKSFVVFRSQLPRKNDYYSFERSVKEAKSSDSPSAEQYQTLCDICGCKAVLTCEKCSKRNYCSEYHKKGDWNWIHSSNCEKEKNRKRKLEKRVSISSPVNVSENKKEDGEGNRDAVQNDSEMVHEEPEESIPVNHETEEEMEEEEATSEDKQAEAELSEVDEEKSDEELEENSFEPSAEASEGYSDEEVTVKKKMPENPFLLPEFEIEYHIEVLPSKKPERSDKEKMLDFQSYSKSDKAPKEFENENLDDLDVVMEDKAFIKFKKRVEHNPKQILRYQRSGNPLLVSAEHVPLEADIPNCECGSKRIFEFQIMSMLLNHLSLDSVEESPDWGTLLIYTCSKSCAAGTNAYVKEFLWKQDISY